MQQPNAGFSHESMIKSLVPPGHFVQLPVTGVHFVLMWHTPGYGGTPGTCHYAAVDARGAEELSAILTQRCSFSAIKLDSMQQEVLRYLFSGVLGSRNPGGDPGASLPADIRYWMEDLRERWSTITDAHRSLYFMLTVYLGRSAPPLPAAGVPGVSPETLAYIQEAIRSGDGIKAKPRDLEGALQAWLDNLKPKK